MRFVSPCISPFRIVDRFGSLRRRTRVQKLLEAKRPDEPVAERRDRSSLRKAVRSGVRCISTPIVNWVLHIMMPLDTCCMKRDGAAHHNLLWPIMCLRLLPIFTNWCILCGDPWMLLTMFLLMLHYVVIYLLGHLFLDGGATFCFNFLIFTVNVFFHCILLHGLWACYWMWMKWMNEMNEKGNMPNVRLRLVRSSNANETERIACPKAN